MVHPAARRHHIRRCHAGPLDQGDATNTKCALHECKGDCTLAEYYLDELKATPSILKYITNSKLVLASKDGGSHIKSSKYTTVFTGHDGSHHTGVAVCAGRGTVCQKLTLGIPVENPIHQHCGHRRRERLTMGVCAKTLYSSRLPQVLIQLQY